MLAVLDAGIVTIVTAGFATILGIVQAITLARVQRVHQDVKANTEKTEEVRDLAQHAVDTLNGDT